MSHVTGVSQWERGIFARKEGYPPIPPFFWSLWRAHGQAWLPSETESMTKRVLDCSTCVFSRW